MSNLIIPVRFGTLPSLNRSEADKFQDIKLALIKKGAFDQAKDLHMATVQAIAKSMEIAPYHHETQEAWRERASLVMKIVNDCVLNKQWLTPKINDKILDLILEELDVVQKRNHGDRGTWGVKDNVILQTEGDDLTQGVEE